MRVTTVSYKKIFPIQQFVNETIGIEMQVDEGDDEDAVFRMAKEMVESWHHNLIVAQWPKKEEVVVSPLLEINRNDEKIEIAIDNAQTIEELNALNKNLPVTLLSHFTKRLTELKKK